MPSAKDVEPRMSANNIDITTSAPPWRLLVYSTHHLQMFGVRFEGVLPNTLINGAPIPW
jgi:hypothetical protein